MLLDIIEQFLLPGYGCLLSFVPVAGAVKAVAVWYAVLIKFHHGSGRLFFVDFENCRHWTKIVLAVRDNVLLLLRIEHTRLLGLLLSFLFASFWSSRVAAFWFCFGENGCFLYLQSFFFLFEGPQLLGEIVYFWCCFLLLKVSISIWILTGWCNLRKETWRWRIFYLGVRVDVPRCCLSVYLGYFFVVLVDLVSFVITESLLPFHLFLLLLLCFLLHSIRLLEFLDYFRHLGPLSVFNFLAFSVWLAFVNSGS